MARSPDAEHACPLYNRTVTWSECVEVQEVREDGMDIKWLIEPIDIDKANEICEKCRWFVVREWDE